jgi:sigma-B regulation protein RsbU (phosphoserine phosphatase)
MIMANRSTPARAFHSIFKNDHPCIGVLIEGLSGVYQKGVWAGIVDAAKNNGLNCLCFTGGALLNSPSDTWDYQRNILYDFAQNYPLSGVVIFGSIASYVEDRRKRDFIARFSHLPIVTLTETESSVPAVCADNRKGMRDLIAHLVESHGCRKFAFVSGPAGNSEAEERFSLLTDTLSRYGLVLDPTGIFAGNFTRESGAKAAAFLASHIADFDVLVTADDQSALGAIEAFRERGISVPEQIAVTGFDDIEESAVSAPPLTTIHQPLFELGSRAVITLLRRMRNEPVAVCQTLQSPLIIRQSCGCFERTPAVVDIAAGGLVDQAEAIVSSLAVKDYALADATKRALSAFFADLPLRRDERFLKILITFAGRKVLGENEITHWSNAIAKAHAYCQARFDPGTAAFASSLLLEASAILRDMTYRYQGFKHIEDAREYYFIHDVGASINASVSVSNMVETIGRELPRMGITDFHVALYDQADSRCTEARLLLSVTGGRNVPLATSALFQSANLLPGPLIETDEPAVCIVEPLFFQSSQFGFAVFNAGQVKTDLFPILSAYISSALHTRLLIDHIESQKETLRAANKELVELRAKEFAYLETVKGELELGQKIQMSFLPQKIPQPSGWEMDAFFMPAREVSGDFYDVFMLDRSTLAFFIGDVSGKDIGAALFMSRIQILLRAITERAFADKKPLSDTMKTVNQYIARQYEQEYATVMFATMFYGCLDLTRGSLRYINAGHPSPVVLNKAMLKMKLPQTGPAIGLDTASNFFEEEITVMRNELLLAFTDGVVEAKNASGEFFSTPRLTALLSEKNPSATAMVARIKSALSEHMKNAVPYDDITMLALYRK